MVKAPLLITTALVLIQCAASTQKEETTLQDSTVSLSEPTPYDSTVHPVSHESASIDLDAFIKDPFLFVSDYEEVKKYLTEHGLIFKDTIFLDRHVLRFGNSSITINISDQPEVIGDLICSADISSPEINFDKGISIGMPLEDFLKLASLTRDSLVQDESSGKSYFQHELPWDGGSWKMLLWFKSDSLASFEYDIYPCEFQYDD